MDFQFLEDYKKLSVKCPPESYKPKNIEVFRWVFDDMNDERNFKPRYFLVPQKDLEDLEKISDTQLKDTKKCTMFALSFFDSEQSAKERFEFFLENKKTGKKAYERFGTNIAKCCITESDGLSEQPNDIGHFNHHPVKNHEYENRFTIVSQL